jgi:pyruvate, water dikinase
MAEPTTKGERLLWALQERAKELNCLYQIEELLNRPEAPLEQVFRGVLAAIPPGWQYPDVCQAKVEYEGAVFTPGGFAETPWVQSASVIVQDRTVGRISVYYTVEMPQADEGPFLKEEGKLIHTIADRLGHFILHQRLRGVFQEWQSARDTLTRPGEQEWRIALHLLRSTDQELYQRISRKMANHLSWSGFTEAQSLLQGLGRPGEEGGAVGELNQPSQRRPVDNSVAVAERIFALAGSYLPDEDIFSRIQHWIHEDRSSFLVKAVANAQSTPAEIVDAIRRYQHLLPAGPGLSASTLNTVRVNLIRRFLSDEPAYLKIAKRYVELDDMLILLERLIHLPGSPGRIGGKGTGLFLASRVLAKAGTETPELGSVRVPKTWYLASDTVMGFIRYNNLEEVLEQKYKPVDQVRLEYPHVVQVFKNAEFPPEIVKGLSVALDDLREGPLIVRSSSILEDRLGAAFSGKYKSLFLANRGSKRERLEALKDAIAEVYSSVFSPDPIQYRAERGLLDLREEMGIMIQEVVGVEVGRYFLPSFAGVAVSNNEFRWSPRIKREDGLIRLVPGLGTRAVDRVGDDYPILIAPGQPGLRVNVTPDEVVRYSPRFLDAIDLEQHAVVTLNVRELLRERGGAYPAVGQVVSTVREGRVSPVQGLFADFQRDDFAVTFDGLIRGGAFVRQVGGILHRLQDALGTPADLEFASDGTDFYLLQCRPQSYGVSDVAATIPTDVPRDRMLFSAHRYVSNGRVADITHVVYVDPDGYDALTEMADLQAVGRAVSRLNSVLPKRQFILMGPGRWGSRGDIKLGVNVSYSDICNAAMLVEIARARGNYLPDLSFGTHFFQDLVEASIRYLPLYPDDVGVVFNSQFLRESANELAALAPDFASLAGVVRVVDVPKATAGLVLRVLMNAELEAAVGVLAEPGRSAEHVEERHEPSPQPQLDHWRWRLLMAERVASQLDAERFGVKALYLIGSAKNATAGPASDIDLLIHCEGTQAQCEALKLWLEGWGLCLDEVNYLRTGQRTGSLLDVHIVTDADVAARSSYAVKIGAITDAARELPLKKRLPSD